MKDLSVSLKIFAYVFITLTVCILLVPRFFLPRRIGRKYRSLLFKIGCCWVCFLWGIKIKVTGPVPKSPCILVSNHLSYIDILVYGSILGPVFIAKSDVRSWPVLGWVCAYLDTIFVRRTLSRDILQVNEDIRQFYEDGIGIVFFPEATSTKGESIAAFKPALLDPAVKYGYPVHYASLRYLTNDEARPAHMFVCWWGDMEFFGHLWELLKLRSIESHLVFGTEALKDTDRENLSKELQKSLQKVFSPTFFLNVT